MHLIFIAIDLVCYIAPGKSMQMKQICIWFTLWEKRKLNPIVMQIITTADRQIASKQSTYCFSKNRQQWKLWNDSLKSQVNCNVRIVSETKCIERREDLSMIVVVYVYDLHLYKVAESLHDNDVSTEYETSA